MARGGGAMTEHDIAVWDFAALDAVEEIPCMVFAEITFGLDYHRILVGL